MTAFPVLTRVCLLAVAIALAAPALARPATSNKPTANKKSAVPQTPPPVPVDLRKIYPPKSIDSEETAKSALKDVKKERSAIEARLKYEQHMCYEKEFLANRCVQQAKERRRLALNEVRSVQIEANQYKRHAAVVKRNEAMATKRENEPQDQASRAASAEAHTKRMANQQQRSKKKQQAAESQREENEEAYAKKLKQAEERKRKVAINKAKNEEKRRRKAAAQAKKNQSATSETKPQEPTKR